MKILSTEGLTELIQLIKDNYISNSDTTQVGVVSLADVATSGDYSDLLNKPTVDQTYNPSSTNAQSGTAVSSAISSAISSVYKAAGSVTFANLPVLSSSIEGYVYDISDDFTTTADFVEGAGNNYPAGTNVVCINTAASGQSAVYKWDVLSALADLSGYLPLTGGTLTGKLTLDVEPTNPSDTQCSLVTLKCGSTDTNEITISKNKYSRFLNVPSTVTFNGNVQPTGIDHTLGMPTSRWVTLYANSISSRSSFSQPDYLLSIPKIDGIIAVQVSTVPTADATHEGKIVQYVGADDSNTGLIHGYFYECVSDGESTPTYSWKQTDTQGGNYLPLTGGTLTGSLTMAATNDVVFDSNNYGQRGRIIAKNLGGSSWTAIHFPFSKDVDICNFLRVVDSSGNYIVAPDCSSSESPKGNLGTEQWPWLKVKSKYLSGINGTDLEIPIIGKTWLAETSTLPSMNQNISDGLIALYVGETTSDYTNGYLYKAVVTTIPDSYDSVSQTVGNSLSNITVDIDGLYNRFKFSGYSGSELYIRYYDGYWHIPDAMYMLRPQDFRGELTYTGTPEENDEITVVNWVRTHNETAWVQTNVQPSVDPLPSQSGNAGKFLTTDGTDTSWSDKPLVNESSKNTSIMVKSNLQNIPGQSVMIGQNTWAGNGGNSANTTLIGYSAQGGARSVAIGTMAGNVTAEEAVAIGANATLPSGSHYDIAVGNDAKIEGWGLKGAMQFGKGTNTEAGTVCFGLTTDGTTFNNYKLLDSNGTIPEARLADTTSAAQNQVLQLDSNLNAVWATVDSLPSQTGQSGKVLTTDGTDASWGTVGATIRIWGENE